MSFEEKGVWAGALITVLAYGAYVLVILGRAQDVPITEVAYVWPLVISIASPQDAGRKDERDREIHWRGEHIGQSMVVVGGVAALLMAMFEVEYFWIANVIYLCFVASALLAATAKIVAYRKGFVGW